MSEENVEVVRRSVEAFTAGDVETMLAYADADGELHSHSCRHTFASLMIAAGLNAKALSTFMGHANISSPWTVTAT
jgi:site-specific recombinase XerD